ncbi:hypothetical protein [Sulfuriroseicoccus oceanibius]|uniref:Uncharacterized protein n=1 Tax=Sulfuriroseicoccus oceanibius TaxID=2707525 RepID=A0A6B3L8Y8_9BACT|nr:hypothetical protein [Sulfuriroseicoccus oceanibius]QQL45500.1 hypothetical protein G3M56_002610 [Sulfuriroseicoccus oceanibius]
MKTQRLQVNRRRGLALVTVLALMSLLIVLLVALLQLTTTDQAASSQSRNQLEAQANAKLALARALGELQEQMGPDQRVSSFATVLDANEETPEIDGVGRQRLLGVWDSWGDWLNADYRDVDGADLGIEDTYDRGRSRMFRRWLVSAPLEDAEALASVDYAKNAAPSDDNYQTLLGQGSVVRPEDEVRAYLEDTGAGGRVAWWIGGRNQAVDVQSFGEKPKRAAAGDVELASGDRGVLAVNTVPGFENLPEDESILEKLIDQRQIELASVDREAMREKYFDVAEGTTGVLADVRWGGLKKDLNLLFEASSMPREFTRSGKTAAPGPRPLSSDLRGYGPKLANRAFSSFEQMREFYRSYKKSGQTPLEWEGDAPETPLYLGHNGTYGHAADQGYRRTPVVAKHYSVYSLFTTRSSADNSPNQGDRANLFQNDIVFSSVVVLWNPYNVPLELPSGYMLTYTLPYKILPSSYVGYRDGRQLNANWIRLAQGANYNQMGRDFAAPIRSNDGQPIRFEPGQFRIFSKKGLSGYGGNVLNEALTPGYDPTGAFGQRMRVYSNKPAGDSNRWGVAVRLDPWWNTDGTAYYWGGNPGAFGNLLWHPNRRENYTMGTMYDWTGPDNDYVEISGTANNAAEVANYDFNVRDRVQPFCVIGITLKSAYESDYGAVGQRVKDYRSKNWLQSLNATSMQKMNVNYRSADVREMQRLDSGYRLHFTEVNSVNDVSKLFNVDGATQELSSLDVDQLVYSVPTLEVPTVPITSIAGFAGMRLTPGWYRIPNGGGPMNAMSRFNDNTEAYNSGVPGIGVGNSFAQPTIRGSRVYQYHDVSKLYPSSDSGGRGGQASTDSNAFSDYWDHALLVNDGLWDSWFASSFVDATRPTGGNDRELRAWATRFFEDGEPLPYTGYEPSPAAEATPQQAITDVLGNEGYEVVARYLLNQGAFNVNSTSEDAWFALFSGLNKRDVAFRDGSGSLAIRETDNDGSVVVSRFATPVGGVEVDDPRQGVQVEGVGRMWTGVREISEDQLRRLAQECVKQVKLRGPFLNMSDFINRRLTDDRADDLNRYGALQAAIDYDDDAPEPGSINGMYKQGEDMIPFNANETSVYPFQRAAGGSRFTAAPGYVVQSDLLRPLGNSLTVRDDSFVIRAYGEKVTDAGEVISRAWCEAVVRRLPEYVDGNDDPEEPVFILDQVGNPSENGDLSEINKRFGRKLQVISFRWLDADEV